MPLLYMLAPEVLPLEQLGTFWYFAPPLGLVLLLDIFVHLVFDRFLKRLSTQFPDVNVLRLE